MVPTATEEQKGVLEDLIVVAKASAGLELGPGFHVGRSDGCE
jgi:hypothetical protein